jgi:hypothetical protein
MKNIHILPQEEPKNVILGYKTSLIAQKLDKVEIDWLGFPKSTQKQVGYVESKEECTCKEHDPYCCQVHGTCPTCVKQEELKTNLERLPFLELIKELAEYYKEVPLVEKPKQECTCENPTDNTCDYCEKENKIEILEEAKKRALEEELEEAANRLFPISKGGSMWMPSTHDCNQANKQEGFIVGAKYMAERMYSEEDLRNAYRWGTTVNHGTKEHFNEWFEQFKKK